MLNIIFSNSAKHLEKKLKTILPKNKFCFINIAPNNDNKFFFPDNESYLRIENPDLIKNKDVLIIFSGQTKDNKPNDALTELEIILFYLKNKAKNIYLIFTYLPYAMQDNEFKAGEANVSKCIIEKYLIYFGVKKIIAFDAHCSNKKWFLDIEKKAGIKNIIEPIFALFKEQLNIDYKDADNFLFIGPDFGAQERLKFSGFGKKRINSFDVEINQDSFDLKKIYEKNICVCDDLIESGGTLCRVAEILKKAGAKKIIAFATHGVLFSGLEKIKNAYDEIYITNSINNSYANLDISEIIKEELCFYF